MTSPICLVNSSTTTNGVDVTAGSTVTIALADTGGVSQWNLTCLYTDELNSAATINAGLSVNLATKTATFTAPASLGSALIFQSVVNNGRDINGVVQASYTTTFKVSVMTATSLRVAAFNETLENNASFGWVGLFNNMVRSYTGSSASAGLGMYFSAGAYNVGQNADNTIKVNAHDIQLNPSFYGSSAVVNTLCERDGYGQIQLSTTNGGSATTYGGTAITAAAAMTLSASGGALTLSGSSGITFSSSLSFGTSVSSPTVSQVNVSTNSATGQTLTIQAQNATGTTATGGNLVLTSGTGTSVAGNVIIQTGGSTNVTFNPTAISLSQPTIQFGNTVSSPIIKQNNNTTNSATGATLTLQSQSCTGTTSIGGNLSLASGTGTSSAGSVVVSNGSTVNTTFVTTGVTLSQAALQFASTVSSPTISQAAIATNSTNGQTIFIEAQNANGTSSNGGNICLVPGTGTAANGNLGLFSATISAGGGTFVLYVANCTSAPSTNPSGGGILYAQGGALKWRGSSGTVTTLGAA